MLSRCMHRVRLVSTPAAWLRWQRAFLVATFSACTQAGDVTGVQFVVTGGALSNQVVGTASATLYGWVALWDTTSVPNGSYTLDSVATEVGGTTATSTGITVTVNNPA